MKVFKGIISCFLSFAIAISTLCVPAYAAIDPGLLIDGAAVAADFGDWVIGSLQSFNYWVYGTILDKDVCPRSGPTGNGRHIFEAQHTTINGKLGNYYVCKNCGKSAGEVLEPAYQDQVSELPAQTYNSDGSLYLTPAHKYIYAGYGYSTNIASCEHSGSTASSSYCNSVFDCSSYSMILSVKSGKSSFDLTWFGIRFSFTTPIDGYYSILQKPIASGHSLDVDLNRFPLEEVFSSSYSGSPSISRVFYSAESELNSRLHLSQSSGGKCSYDDRGGNTKATTEQPTAQHGGGDQTFQALAKAPKEGKEVRGPRAAPPPGPLTRRGGEKQHGICPNL